MRAIKSIKFFCLEEKQVEVVQASRKQEVSKLSRYYAFDSLCYTLSITISLSGALIAFYLKSTSGTLTTGILLAISQFIVFLIAYTVSFSVGVACLVQLNVVLSRFKGIYFHD